MDKVGSWFKLSDAYVVLEAAEDSMMAAHVGEVIWDVFRAHHPELWRSFAAIENKLVSDSVEGA